MFGKHGFLVGCRGIGERDLPQTLNPEPQTRNFEQGSPSTLFCVCGESQIRIPLYTFRVQRSGSEV